MAERPLPTGGFMDLHTGDPYWLMKNGYNQSFPALTHNITTDVCILGAGITGALAAHALAREGVGVVVLDKRHPGMGSTCASTALLQYEIDEPLHSLIRLAGRKRAEQSYLACYHAIDAVRSTIESENLPVSFVTSPSLQYASSDKHVRLLKKEYMARRAIGLDVGLLTGVEIRDLYGFRAPAGLLSSQGAQVDAYQLAHALLGCCPDTLRVYDTAEVVALRPERRSVTVKTADGHRVKADRLIVACGYESQRFLPKPVVELSSTYAIIGKPSDRPLWTDHTLLWETKTPYLYARTTADNRAIVGGRDDEEFNPKKRHNALPKKADKLVGDFRRLFPDLPFHLDFTWAGAFGGTKDSLAYVGRYPGIDNTYFILGFGGNGIVFSQTGAEIVRDAVLGRKNPLADLYSFER